MAEWDSIFNGERTQFIVSLRKKPFRRPLVDFGVRDNLRGHTSAKTQVLWIRGVSITSLFGTIAPFYALFYSYQKRYYGRILDLHGAKLGLFQYSTVIDIGCGTGALCSALQERGLKVTGVDSEQKMINIAKRNNPNITFLKASALNALPFNENSFSIAFASYVAHGLKKHERVILYKEMSRLAKHLVIIHDFNSRRSRVIDLIETLEGGDYFGFIDSAKDEIVQYFKDVRFIDVGPLALWYMGSPI